jgi:hypothetical protein
MWKDKGIAGRGSGFRQRRRLEEDADFSRYILPNRAQESGDVG